MFTSIEVYKHIRYISCIFVNKTDSSFDKLCQKHNTIVEHRNQCNNIFELKSFSCMNIMDLVKNDYVT